MVKTVGILALQGSFDLHKKALSAAGCEPVLVKSLEQLAELDGLVLPGGESTTLLKLLDHDFREAIRLFTRLEKPVLATCAGLILIAKEVHQSTQETLGLLDVVVCRNGYGRQIDSFITEDLQIKDLPLHEAVFIRAPRILDVGDNASVLVSHKSEPVLVNQGRIYGATYHPEMCADPGVLHRTVFNPLS